MEPHLLAQRTKGQGSAPVLPQGTGQPAWPLEDHRCGPDPGRHAALQRAASGWAHTAGDTPAQKLPPKVTEARFQTSLLKSFLPLWTSWKTTALVCIFLHIPVATDAWKSGNPAQILTGKGEDKKSWVPPSYVPDPFNFDFYFLSRVFHLLDKVTWPGSQGVPRHLPFVTKPKRRDNSCWCLRQQREFSAASRFSVQNNHGWGGRKSPVSQTYSSRLSPYSRARQVRTHLSPGLQGQVGQRPLVALLKRCCGSPRPRPPSHPHTAQTLSGLFSSGGVWGRKSHLRTRGTEKEVTLLEGPTRSTTQSPVTVLKTTETSNRKRRLHAVSNNRKHVLWVFFFNKVKAILRCLTIKRYREKRSFSI